MSRPTEPIFTPSQCAWMRKGRGRAAKVRQFRADRCSPAEIAEFLRVDVYQVRRDLRRVVA